MVQGPAEESSAQGFSQSCLIIIFILIMIWTYCIFNICFWLKPRLFELCSIGTTRSMFIIKHLDCRGAQYTVCSLQSVECMEGAGRIWPVTALSPDRPPVLRTFWATSPEFCGYHTAGPHFGQVDTADTADTSPQVSVNVQTSIYPALARLSSWVVRLKSECFKHVHLTDNYDVKFAEWSLEG